MRRRPAQRRGPAAKPKIALNPMGVMMPSFEESRLFCGLLVSPISFKTETYADAVSHLRVHEIGDNCAGELQRLQLQVAGTNPSSVRKLVEAQVALLTSITEEEASKCIEAAANFAASQR